MWGLCVRYVLKPVRLTMNGRRAAPRVRSKETNASLGGPSDVIFRPALSQTTYVANTNTTPRSVAQRLLDASFRRRGIIERRRNGAKGTDMKRRGHSNFLYNGFPQMSICIHLRDRSSLLP